jgi:hypothetical protein
MRNRVSSYCVICEINFSPNGIQRFVVPLISHADDLSVPGYEETSSYRSFEESQCLHLQGQSATRFLIRHISEGFNFLKRDSILRH